MLYVTKIFRFETAHAIHGYNGQCKNIHGHSYILHVTVANAQSNHDYLPSPGFIYDFKELKHLVNKWVIQQFDHRLVVSEAFVNEHAAVRNLENLSIWEMEPTAENILLFVRNTLQKNLPGNVVLQKLKLYETGDSYAEWQNAALN